MDRNILTITICTAWRRVALRKESVDRNSWNLTRLNRNKLSLSARRAWIEIRDADGAYLVDDVALRKESVDRN